MKKIVFCLFLLFLTSITYSYQHTAKNLHAGMNFFFNCGYAGILNFYDAVLNNFTANAEGKKVNIQWSTSSETDSSYFVLERSTDAQTWDTLTTVTGKGPTNNMSSYQVFDNSPVVGANYYRLLYESDNRDTTSVVRIVSISPITITGLNIFPNPASYYISFTLDYLGNNFNSVLINAIGRTVDKETFEVNPSQTYSLQFIPSPGVYILKVTASGLSKSQRVVVE